MNEKTSAPVTAAEFARSMESLGLVPARGPVAVAVSGGADSMALILLAEGWGEAVAVTVDHGLRSGSASEAESVGRWLAARGIAHHVLHWEGEKPESGLQAAARAARYRLLEGWCRENGIDALLLAHHRDDQAETLLLRLARGSGLWGLAGMAALEPPLSEPDLGSPHRFRPLLALPKARLEATCRAAGQDWIVDPTNRDLANARVRARAMLADPPLEGLDSSRLAGTAHRLRRARAALETYVARLLGEAARFDPAGYAELSRSGMLAEPAEVGLRALERLLTAVGGRTGPPRGERIEQAYDRIAGSGFAGLTTLGCQLLAESGADRILICREPAAVAGELGLGAGEEAVWDGRFRIRNRSARALTVGPLGETGWRELARDLVPDIRARLPEPAGRTLPALREGARLVAVAPIVELDVDCAVEARFLPLVGADGPNIE